MIWMSGWPPPKSHRRTSWLKFAWTVCAHAARNKAASAAYLIMSPPETSASLRPGWTDRDRPSRNGATGATSGMKGWVSGAFGGRRISRLLNFCANQADPERGSQERFEDYFNASACTNDEAAKPIRRASNTLWSSADKALPYPWSASMRSGRIPARHTRYACSVSSGSVRVTKSGAPRTAIDETEPARTPVSKPRSSRRLCDFQSEWEGASCRQNN